MNETKAIWLCLKKKDPVGFEFLAKKYQRQAYFHGLSFMGNPEDAIEACQEAFAKAFIAMPRLASLKNFYPWYYSILKNHCFNLLKREKKGEEVKEVLSPHSQPDRMMVDKFVEGAEDKKIIWSVLRKLKPEFSEILIMKHMEGLSYNEISKILGVPRGTVMSRLYHARSVFRDEYLRVTERSKT